MFNLFGSFDYTMLKQSNPFVDPVHQVFKMLHKGSTVQE